ncbi:MAG: Dabb family protein [Eubacteriales bacterium]
MIMHIVMWKFKDENKLENMNTFKKMLMDLPPIIEEVKHMEVGMEVNLNQGNYDMVLVSEFKSMEDLEKYKNHPEHQKASEFCKGIRIERTCVDYEI